MKIKKLSIHGFKSFVDKTTLNFSLGTSAIIGPNGCGKSNVVDAIRWVIGEQNPRHLRGKHMEDVIFNGSDTRKPLGMAEVVLTFSNEEGNAPARYANFTEIEIARRLYRSGESEYYINKVQSRLRDIVELFTDTGIGTRAYSIVEQGQVGWLVNAKPEERRALFEEAAGINKFKHKKEAAIRRLEATKENLARVSDIISEVKRQLNSLNRQAKKAERYKELRGELQDVELRLSAIEFRRLKGEIEDAHSRLEGLKDEELALQNLAISKEALAEEERGEYLRVESEFKSVREDLFGIERRIQNEERSSALVNARMEELRRNVERLGKEIEDLGRSAVADGALLDSLRETLSGLTALIDDEARRLEEESTGLSSVMEGLRSKEEGLRDLKTESLRISTRITDIRHSIQVLLKDEENCRVREARASSEIESLKNALEGLAGPLAGLRASIEESLRRKASIEAELEGTRKTLDGLEAEKGVLSIKLSAMKEEHSLTASRLTALEEMERNYENIQGGARSIMKNRGSGIHGILADCLEANPGFEKAVEAALGERLQYVIVESQKEGVEAVEYLKRNSGGRGSFVPVRDLRAAAQPVPAGAGVEGGARGLLSEVRVREGYEAIVNYLLGDVLLVADLDTALDLWRRNGVYRTLVTMDGDVVDPQGVITGGGQGSKDPGILQRRVEIRDCRLKATELEGEVAGAEERLKAIEEDMASTKKLIEDLKERLHSEDLERLNLEGELKRHGEESERIRASIESFGTELKEAAEKLSAISAKKAGLSGERESLEEALKGKNEEASRLESEISAISERKERLYASVTELKVSLAKSRERLEAIKKEIASKEASIEDTRRKIEAREAEIRSSEIETGERNSELASLKASIEALLSEAEMVKRLEVEKGETLAAITDRISSIEAELKEIKGKTSELQELKGELSIDLKELELGLNNLREKTIEKYGTDPEAIAPPEPGAPEAAETLEARRNDLREKITALGEVSLSALEEYNELERRHQFLLDQQKDLNDSVGRLHTAITRINRTTRERFRAAFDEINEKFKESFPRFFRGGRAELRLSEDSDILDAGIEIVAQPPGKRLQNITLLSGGEKALTATSLIFAIFLTKPSPFCLLDEVDAPLDDANIDRFNAFVKEMSKISQFILITHNKKTMEMVDTLYGVTMQEPGTSNIITLKF